MMIMDGTSEIVKIEVDRMDVMLEGRLSIPGDDLGIILLLGGSGSLVEQEIEQTLEKKLLNEGFMVFNTPVLTEKEMKDPGKLIDVDKLRKRIGVLLEWLENRKQYSALNFGLVASKSMVEAAIRVSLHENGRIKAISSISGHINMRQRELNQVTPAILLLVGEKNSKIHALNMFAYQHIPEPRSLEIIKDAGELISDETRIDEITGKITKWFVQRVKKRVKNRVIIPE